MIGGCDGNLVNYLNSMERFDPRESNKCVPMKLMSKRRRNAAAVEHNGFIYVIGGWGEMESPNIVEMFCLHLITFKFTILMDLFFHLPAYPFNIYI